MILPEAEQLCVVCLAPSMSLLGTCLTFMTLLSFLVFCGPSALRWSDRSSFRVRFPWTLYPSAANGFRSLEFDSSLGLPGEGPWMVGRVALVVSE